MNYLIDLLTFGRPIVRLFSPLSQNGTPPLHITQNLQLAQLRFRLYSSPPTPIQHCLWCLWQELLQAVPLDTLEGRMQNGLGQVDPSRRDPNSPMSQRNPLQATQQRKVPQKVL